MDTVILAGGLGTRLRRVVSDRPKVMAEINGKPFLCYLLDQLAEENIERVIISTGYMAGKIEEAVGFSYKGMKVDYSEEETPLGTGGSLKLAGQIVNTKHCLVMNGDSYTEFDLDSLLIKHQKRNTSVTIIVKVVDNTSCYGTIQMDEKNRITDFTEKGNTSGKGIINTGVYLMKTSVLYAIPEKIHYSLENDFFPRMVGNGIYGYETKGKFIDIGTPASYLSANEFFKKLNVSFDCR